MKDLVCTLQSQSDCSFKRKSMKRLQFSVYFMWKVLYAFDLFVRALDLGAVMKWQKLDWLVVINKNLYLFVSVLVKNWFSNISTMNPIQMVLRSTFFGTLLPKGVVFIDYRCNKIIWFIFPLSWETFGVWIRFASVRIVTNAQSFCPRPDMPEKDSVDFDGFFRIFQH